MDDDFDDIALGDGVTVTSASDENNPSDAAYIVATDPGTETPHGVPTILYIEVSPEAAERPARFGTYISCGDHSGLESQTQWVLASTADRNAGEVALARSDAERDRLKRLYEGTTDPAAAGMVDELYERAIGLMEHILEFDNTSFFIHDGDSFYVAADDGDITGTGPTPSDTDLFGETHRTKHSFLVDGVRDHPAVNPDDPAYRSVVSVPLGDDGVLQVISNEVGAYDETDLALAGLLMFYVSEMRSRTESETVIRKSHEQIGRLH